MSVHPFPCLAVPNARLMLDWLNPAHDITQGVFAGTVVAVIFTNILVAGLVKADLDTSLRHLACLTQAFTLGFLPIASKVLTVKTKK